MRTRATHLILALATALTLATAQANAPRLVDAFANVVAGRMNGAITACPPATIDLPPRACFTHSLGVEWARMDWDTLISNNWDVTWDGPWHTSDGIYNRFILLRSDEYRMDLQVWIAPRGTYDALVLVLDLTDWDW